MSTNNVHEENVESEEEDDDYSPTRNKQEQSCSSEESEDEPVEEEIKSIDRNITPYDESKTNELWKNFTSSTKPTATTTTTTTTTDSPKVTTKVFDYAGETVSVPIPSTNSSLKRPAAAVASSNSVLDRLGIGKKQKLSTLEKSRLDWNTHKETESLIDDLDSHRRGKDSYVEKKAFLQRSELREHDHYLTNVKKK